MSSSPFLRNLTDTMAAPIIGAFFFMNTVNVNSVSIINTSINKIDCIDSHAISSDGNIINFTLSPFYGETATIDEVQDKITFNFDKLNDIAKFEDGWDGSEAKSFSNSLILKVKQIISNLSVNIQPDLFPTARNSIQLEYHLPDESYLEFEIFENKIVGMQIPRTEYDNASFYELACNDITRIKQIVNNFLNA